MATQESTNPYDSNAAASVAAAIYRNHAAQHDGGQAFIDAHNQLVEAARACPQDERDRVLKLVGPDTMATLPVV